MILLGEGASEGVEGLQFIRDVMFNRSQKTGKSLEEIATQPKQFSAYSRPDLGEFFSRQPPILQQLARELVLEAQQKDFTPKYPDITNYTTTAFYENRDTLPKSHWIHAMEPAFTVGHHTALRPRSRK